MGEWLGGVEVSGIREERRLNNERREGGRRMEQEKTYIGLRSVSGTSLEKGFIDTDNTERLVEAHRDRIAKKQKESGEGSKKR